MRSAFLLGLAVFASSTIAPVGNALAQEAEELQIDSARAQAYPTVRQWAVLEDGQIRGRLVTPTWEDAASPVVGADVMITGEDNVVRRADGMTNTIGEFVVSGLQPGVYTLFAASPKAFVCKAIHVVDTSAGTAHGTEAFTISAAKISRERMLSAISRYLTRSIGRSIPLDIPYAKAMSDNFDPSYSYRVIQTDGGMAGRVLGAQGVGAPLTNVLIYRGGSMVAKTTTDEDGGFFVSDLPPSAYGVFAMGPEGMAITGVELLSEPSGLELTHTDRASYFVRAQTGAILAIQLAPIAQDSPELQELEEPVEPVAPTQSTPIDGALPPAAPLPSITSAGGSFGGGGGGGGSSLGGGGGLGVIGLGVLGAGAAVAIDDDDNAIVPPAASPATP